MVREFWKTVEKVVRYKHLLKVRRDFPMLRLLILRTHEQVEEKKAEMREKQLDFIVEQTERFTSLVAKDLSGASDSPGKTATPKDESTKVYQNEEEPPKTPGSGEPSTDASKDE